MSFTLRFLRVLLFLFVLCVALVTLFAGCALQGASVPGIEHIRLEKKNTRHSPLCLGSLQLKGDAEKLTLVGYVTRAWPRVETAHAHLKIILFDLDGKILRELTVEIQPREIPQGPKNSGYSSFRVVLDDRPSELGRIVVQTTESAVE